MLGSVGGSIVDNKLPGEKASVLSTGGMEMTVERADPASLGGSSIGEGPASFKMPSSGDLFKNANSSSMGAVDKQVRISHKSAQPAKQTLSLCSAKLARESNVRSLLKLNPLCTQDFLL